jgi:tetratricopeptide (TPR) repeat protein
MSKLLKTLSLASALALTALPYARAEGFAGPFLAAKSASIANDYKAAAYYFSQAMVAEPENALVMQGALFALVASGDVAASNAIARQMAAAGLNDEFAHTTLMVNAVAREDYEAALSLLADPEIDMNPLVRHLAAGWSLIARGEVEAGLASFSSASENNAITAFGLYHKGLALAYLGDLAAADTIFSTGEVYVNRGALIAHAQILAQLGREDEALAFMMSGPGVGIADREADQLRARLSAGEPVVFDRISKPEDGIADIFFVLANALQTENNGRLALFYAQLAAYLRPDNAETLLLIGDVLTAQSQFQLALEAYDAVPAADPLALDAKMGRALNLRRNGKLEEAADTLRAALEIRSDAISLWQSLGDVLRQNNQPEQAIEAYSTAIDLLPAPDIRLAWRLYYSRAIVEQKAGDWPSAEADFRQALALNPEQADVLNYLGYSLVDRGEKLDEALGMIETAVKARPDSGAIADSLGWVYYRLGLYDKAEAAMETAVKLLPVDPILSDHFGDVLWMVGRKREARFQWRRALSYGPEADDAVRIRDKLERGLDAVLADE